MSRRQNLKSSSKYGYNSEDKLTRRNCLNIKKYNAIHKLQYLEHLQLCFLFIKSAYQWQFITDQCSHLSEPRLNLTHTVRV